MKKGILILKRAIVIVVLLVIGIFLGLEISNQRLIQDQQKVTCNTIAIVNMDDGIKKENIEMNYAAQLIRFPDINFVNTNITDAKEGIQANKYAAYILIPGDFSKSVTSINEKPQKCLLEYEINTNLRDDIKIKVLNDIYNFTQNISVNISYMYVEAILEEFHDVQDSANEIMQNDKSDMQRLLEINPNSLIEPFNVPDLERENNIIQNVDLSNEFVNAENLTSKISDSYKEFIEKGKKEFEVVKQGETTVLQATENMKSGMDQIELAKDENGNLVYQEGLDELTDVENNFKGEFEQKRNDAITSADMVDVMEALVNLEEGIKLKQETAEIESEEKKNEIKDKLTEWKDANILTEDQVKELENITDGMPSIALDYTTEMEAYKNVLTAYADNVKLSVEAIPIVEINGIQLIIDEKILEPITQKIESEKSRINEIVSSTNTSIQDYTKALETYDPLKYVDSESINGSLGELRKTVNDVENKMNETSDEYIDYVYRVYETTEKNVVDLEESMTLSYEKTSGNIIDSMNDAQASKKKVTDQNTEILEAFTHKLPYTRLGTVEYTEAYNFVVNPLDIKENGTSAKTYVITINDDINKFVFIFIVILLMMYLGLALYDKREENKKEIKEDMLWD